MAKEKQGRKKSRYAKNLETRKRDFGTVSLKVPTAKGEERITIVRPRLST